MSTGANYVMQVATLNDFNRVAKGSLMEFGARDPFFTTPNVVDQYRLVEVEPNSTYLAKYGLKKDDVYFNGKFVFYAVLYPYEGKTVLLVRQASYGPPIDEFKMVSAYRALLDQFDDFADVLIVDQNHNPGGSISYVLQFFQLFIGEGKSASNLVQKFNADRKWYFDFLDMAMLSPEKSATKNLFLQRASFVELAIDSGKSLTDPFPIVFSNTLQEDTLYTWKKPVLVLADELAGSCGDIFPMLIKRNGIAKILGKRTLGLGGTVESSVTLPNSRASVNLTRGLFTSYKADGNYLESDFVENNGISPDIEYNHSVRDFRNGFVDYFNKLSQTAVEQIP
jgi:hypothetical protein